MADKKISALTGATTPLAGSEVLPIVQGGSTVKVSVANLTAGRTTAMSLLDVENSAGGGVLGTLKSNWSTTKISFEGDGSDGSGIINVSNLAGSGAYPFKVKANGTETFKVETNGDTKAVLGNFVVGTAGKGIDFSANTHAAGMTKEVLDWYEEGTWTPTYTGWSINPTTTFARYTRIGRLVTLNYTALDGVSLTGSSEIGGLPFTSSSQQGASVLMKDISGAAISAFGGIGANTNSIGAITSATFTGLYWSFSVSYIV